MSAVWPLERYPLLRTENLDEMRAALAQIYAAPKMEVVGDSRALRVVINHHSLRDVELSFASYKANFRMRFPETDFVSQLFPIRGSGDVRVGSASFIVNSRRSAVISPDQTFDLASNVEYARLILKVNAAAMASKLAALTGIEPAGRLNFHPAQDGAEPAANALHQHFLFLVDTMSSGAPLPELIVKEIEQLLLVMFLYANRHNYSHLLEGQSPDAASGHVRRAEEYIEANWMRPISLEGLAAVTNVSIRSLHRSFKKSRGYSPLGFLQQVRLRQAHALLQQPGPGMTMQEIAFMCGFRTLDRFSAAYVRAFGHRPEETFKRGNGSSPRLH